MMVPGCPARSAFERPSTTIYRSPEGGKTSTNIDVIFDSSSANGISEGALGECLASQRRYAEAEPLLLRSYATIKNVQGEHGSSTLEAARRLMTLYQSWGKPDEAARYQEALAPAPGKQAAARTP
jgi:hypothetical protein